MSLSASLAVSLANMPSLAELFRLFLSGKHLNRLAEPTLWAELEKQEADYSALFAALGYELRIDARGFAWFHTTEANSNIGKTSRQLALLFMVLFEAQANAGKPLLRFSDWLVELINRASSLGFAVSEPAGWRLLPAVCRYLDHFESLAGVERDEREDASDLLDSATDADDAGNSDNADEEENG